MKEVYVEFVSSDYSYGFTIYSHYTTILGLDSGEGKTWMFETLVEMANDGELELKSEYPVVFVQSANMGDSIDRAERSILIIDEATISRDPLVLRKLNSCKHLIVAITRAVPFRDGSPLDGIYRVNTIQDSRFEIVEINSNNELRVARCIKDIDVVITESAKDCSEHMYLAKMKSLYCLPFDLIAAGGKNKIASILRQFTLKAPDKRLLVLMDLANASSQYKLLTKRCKDNSNIFFYAYESFEELLYKSNLVSLLGRDCDKNPFDFYSLERYCANALEEVTKGSVLAYEHRHPSVSDCYVVDCKECKEKCSLACEDKIAHVLDSEPGRLLYEWVEKLNGLQVNKTNGMNIFS